MAVMQMTQNMGINDRIVRGTLGSLMLANGLMHLRHSPIRWVETVIGGAFTFYGLTGFDPLLKWLGVSTIPGSENHILHVAKQVAPGQGINPMQTQQAVPKQATRGADSEQSVSDAMTIP